MGQFWVQFNTYGYVGGNPVGFVDPQGLRPLTDCEKRLLAPFFYKEDLDNADLHDGGIMASFIDKDYRAMTIYNDIYIRPGVYDSTTSAGIALLAHELAHVEQYNHQGLTLKKYIEASRKNKNEHDKNSYEIPAMNIEGTVRALLDATGDACTCQK